MCQSVPTICGYMELSLADQLGHDLAPDCCDQEARFVYSEIVDQVARVLFDKHKVSVSDRYGKCTASGYVADPGPDGQVRVSHRMPEPDLLDDDRMSDDEMAAERHEMVGAYADTLEAAGWTVARPGPRSRKPYLLASKP